MFRVKYSYKEVTNTEKTLLYWGKVLILHPVNDKIGTIYTLIQWEIFLKI